MVRLLARVIGVGIETADLNHLASSHRAMLKRLTKIILILMSQMRDLLWEMVTEPLFWPVMLVLAGMFAYLGVTY
jgi:hypothetical protein